jgi:hypothetical protein
LQNLSPLMIFVPMVLMVGALLALGWALQTGKKCPSCERRHTFGKTGEKRTEGGGDTGLSDRYFEEMHCQSCGHREWKEVSTT